jgi:hypothetical protein
MHCGYSAAQLSRYERGVTHLTDITLLRALSVILAIPPADLGLASEDIRPGVAESPDHRFIPPGSHSVAASDSGKDDPVRRRSLLLGAGLAAPAAALLARVDSALAVIPAPRSPGTPARVASLLSTARSQFEDGQLTELVLGLPELLAAGHDLIDRSPGDERHLALLAGSYDLAAEAMHKAGTTQAARLTADRGVTYARLSGDPVAEAMAARSLAIVLRHEGRQDLAAEVTRTAANRLAAGGLKTGPAANAFALVLCTAAYSAAQACDRGEATAMITDARTAARHIPRALQEVPRFVVSPAQVALYEVGIAWSLGEPGAALNAARGLSPGQFPTPERRARLFTDMARVWDQAGQPYRAIGALLSACGHAASEVRDRPSIRSLGLDLIRSNPVAAGADRLAAILSSGRR